MSQHEVNGDHESWTAKQQQFWNSTITNWSLGAKDLWKNPRVTLIRIEALVSGVAVVLLLLAIFGSQRRRSRNWFLQKGVFGAYTLSYSVAIYILGSMQSSGVKSSMYPIWAISLIMLHGCTDSITAYSLDDNNQQSTLTYQAYMYFAYAMLLLVSVGTVYTLPLVFMVFIAFVRYAQRLAVCGLAGRSWNMNKMVADYMYKDQNQQGVFAATMEECNFLVHWPIRESKFEAPTYATQLTAEDEAFIDVRKIWQCKKMSIDLKDACLSFSLFHLLRSRCFRFACDGYKASANNFVFKVLLSEAKKQDRATYYDRVFRVIEVELAFMYDFFFTKYAVIYYGSMAATVWSLVSAIGISLTAYITAMAPVKITQRGTAVASSVTDDIVITIAILASIALLEFLQLLVYWTGIWGRVSFVCQSVREEARSKRKASQIKRKGAWWGSCCIMGLKRFLANIDLCLASCIMGLKELLSTIGLSLSCASSKHYWQHKLGQYSLLDSVISPHEPGPLSTVLACFFGNRLAVIALRVVYLVDHAFAHQTNAQASMARQKAGKPVELPDEVKAAVISSLERSDGTLSNGRSSLLHNGADDLSWACKWEMHQDAGWSQRKQNQTHIILTWHIATWYCEMVKFSSAKAEEEQKVHFSIATKLSRYCAYLVVSAPRLLPGHHYDTVRKFDAAAVEATTLLQAAAADAAKEAAEAAKAAAVGTTETAAKATTAAAKATMEAGDNKYYYAMNKIESTEEGKIFKSGVRLGKQLEVMEEGTRWKVMADFWAEMLLYLAPSENVQEHIQQLAQGGEFITHLWALLSHAGILQRPEQEQRGLQA